MELTLATYRVLKDSLLKENFYIGIQFFDGGHFEGIFLITLVITDILFYYNQWGHYYDSMILLRESLIPFPIGF